MNGPGNDVTPTVFDDGHSLFFASARPGSLGHGDIYVSHRVHTRDDFAWQPPIHLGVSINSAANEIGPSFVTRTRTLYFSVDAPAAPGEIMASELQPDGTFSVPLPVHEVNSSSDELRPTVRRDGLEMYFDSNRPGGLGGTDIWVATRDSVHDPWRTPVNAGPAINSAASEARAALSFDRLGLIFQSTRPGGSGGVDLYSSTRRLYAPRRSATAP